ncbi:MAG TPA: amidohydrolase family protein [Bacteroidales bacterium]|nr:amidohydrolase family protein [Bacteroidales bacterium]HNR41904.1 amidohydrolase family protein [Bacteroidales bacterium]HQG76568.1 amidohydrolase family protein [Bacteroidales bacterium]
MKQFSAQFIFTNCGPPLKRGVITTDDDGTVISAEDTGGELKERAGLEFHNGIIIPGFVNCHCHLELSGLVGKIPSGKGLGGFIYDIMSIRDRTESSIAALRADRMLFNEGVVLCADVCNTDATFELKTKSRIKYISLLEVLGTDPDAAQQRFSETLRLSEAARSLGLEYSVVPHSFYSLSLTLLRLVKSATASNRVTSIHFMESGSETEFLANNSGDIKETFENSWPGIKVETVKDHASAILEEITLSGNLILVHNTFTGRSTVRKVRERDNIFWCLCPRSNLYIENQLPEVGMLIEEGCRVVTGTDSLASNSSLSILEELKTIQDFFPSIPLETLVSWATLNGARALCEESTFGSIAPGKKPGLLLIQNADLANLRLTRESRVSRLI